MRKHQRLELVRVLTPGFLVNSAQHACRYETDDGKTLAPGHYIALGSDDVIHYGRGVRYFGPFETVTEVRFLQTSATAIGIVKKAVPAPPRKTSASSIGQVGRACDAVSPQMV